MRRALLTAGLAAAFLGATALAAVAQPRQVEIANRSSHAMIQFFASSVTTQDWGDDILGSTLAAGQVRQITLAGGAAGGCLYDLKAVFDDGRAVERHAVNVCRGPVPAFEDEQRH
jgi:hypothetical protein